MLIITGDDVEWGFALTGLTRPTSVKNKVVLGSSNTHTSSYVLRTVVY